MKKLLKNFIVNINTILIIKITEMYTLYYVTKIFIIYIYLIFYFFF